MVKFGKWIGGGLGWAIGGPIGALLGFALGAFVDGSGNIKKAGVTTRGDFAVSFMVLVSSVMKADGKILKSELDFVKTYLIRAFGHDVAQEMITILKDLLKKDIPIEKVGQQIRMQMDYSSRLQLLHFMYGISRADGEVHVSEIGIIDRIATSIGISMKDRISIKNMFVEDNDSAYKILEIERNANIEDIKKAYRKMAKKYHPDKVSHLGAEVQNAANLKFKKVNEAYEKIKKERGVK